MPVGDIYTIRVGCMTGNQLGLNIWHYRTTTETASGATPAEIADRFDIELAPLYKPLLAATAEYLGITVQRIRPLPPGLEGTATSRRGPGTATGDLLPKQTAGLITWRTAFAGRKFRGRSYIPFPAEGSNAADSTPEPVYVVQLATIRDFRLTSPITIGGAGTTILEPVIFHRILGTADRILSGVVRDAWATQRRRGTFGRPNAGQSFGPIVIG